ncbi:hypothetical protein [Amycolatopsis japonica]
MAERFFGGWEFRDRLDDGGLILDSVWHRDYPLASDIRFPRVWVAAPPPRIRSGGPDPLLKAKKRAFVLGKDMHAKSAPYELVRGGQSIGDFALYPVVGGLGVDYEAEIAIPGVRNDVLTVSQRYLFGAYSKHPAHEPGSVLRAARFFPLLEFRLKPGKENLPGPSYFRADLRFDLALHRKGDGHDLGGVFRDEEHVSLSIADENIHGGRPPLLQDVFAGAEKPLHHDLIGPGLRERTKRDTGPDLQTWDNYHHFPSAEDGSLPSSPGAFHCFHTHWRWGAVSAKGMFPVLAGGRQFAGLNWTEELGGPLIDPRIPDQDLTFAVTTDSRHGTPLEASANPSEWPFADLFTRWRAEPAPIKKDGAKITFWISVEVSRPDGAENREWGGTLLPHGMFFSHEPEPELFDFGSDVPVIVPIQAKLAGLRNALVKESVPASASPMPWWRYPPGPKK